MITITLCIIHKNAPLDFYIIMGIVGLVIIKHLVYN